MATEAQRAHCPGLCKFQLPGEFQNFAICARVAILERLIGGSQPAHAFAKAVLALVLRATFGEQILRDHEDYADNLDNRRGQPTNNDFRGDVKVFMDRVEIKGYVGTHEHQPGPCN